MRKSQTVGALLGALLALTVVPAIPAAEHPAALDVQGHRGARGLAPENTLAGFRRALAVGVTTLELDVGMTRDGVLVVSHDSRLNPDLTRDAAGAWIEDPGPALRELSFDELRRYDVGRARPGSMTAELFADQHAADGERIPALAEVLALAPAPVRFNIETKLDPRKPELAPPPEAFAEALVRELRRAGVAERASIQSFDWRTLKHAARLAPEIERVCLTTLAPRGGNLQPNRPGVPPTLAGLDLDDFAGSVPKLVRAAKCAVWSPQHAEIEGDALAEAQALGLRVVPWTVNAPTRMEELLAMGVDGIITDYPDRLRQVMRARGLPLPEPRAR